MSYLEEQMSYLKTVLAYLKNLPVRPTSAEIIVQKFGTTLKAKDLSC